VQKFSLDEVIQEKIDEAFERGAMAAAWAIIHQVSYHQSGMTHERWEQVVRWMAKNVESRYREFSFMDGFPSRDEEDE
jgi:pyruvate dehydrogenase complex dehydrogenase (E1) component